MIATVDSLFDQALSLSEESRLELADRLYSATLPVEDEPDPGQMAVVLRRMEEVESGKVETIDADEVFRQIEAALASKA